jgi:hypothetical protein
LRKLILIGLIIILTLIALYFIWWNLPLTINRHSEIKLGDKVIENIDDYRKTNRKLPQWNDWEALKRLGIQFDNDVSIPEYKNLNDSIYELYFIKGFDGPYLMWNSIERKWKMGFPSYDKK